MFTLCLDVRNYPWNHGIWNSGSLSIVWIGLRIEAWKQNEIPRSRCVACKQPASDSELAPSESRGIAPASLPIHFREKQRARRGSPGYKGTRVPPGASDRRPGGGAQVRPPPRLPSLASPSMFSLLHAGLYSPWPPLSCPVLTLTLRHGTADGGGWNVNGVG
jgi:hypothetical protein